MGISIYLKAKSRGTIKKINIAIDNWKIAFAISVFAIETSVVGFEHLETVVVKNQIYHLAIRYSIVDINYFLFRCDRFDAICCSIYNSPDYTEQEKAILRYDRSDNKLKVQVGGREIYSKSL